MSDKALDEGRLQPVDKEALKPCPNPWCVSTSRPLPAFASRSETWSVICGCGVRSFGRDTEAEAIDLWNAHQSETGAALPSVNEKSVMVCPQCEGEGGYPDGLDEAACHTDCTRCAGNGWIVDLAALAQPVETGAALPSDGREAAKVEAYILERIEGEGYGKARRVLDAMYHNPTSDDYFVNAEAKARHRVTPLYAALAQPVEAGEDGEEVCDLCHGSGNGQATSQLWPDYPTQCRGCKGTGKI